MPKAIQKSGMVASTSSRFARERRPRASSAASSARTMIGGATWSTQNAVAELGNPPGISHHHTAAAPVSIASSVNQTS